MTETVGIPLTRGLVATVSREDFDLIEHKWFADWAKNTRSYYARRAIRLGPNRQGSIRMHREILSRVLGRPLNRFEVVDHINHNTLDNRRHNIRLATKAQNARNQRRAMDNTSGYKGVSWDKKSKKWRANIRVNYRLIHLGFFADPQEAAAAYNTAAVMLHEDFARLNP